MSISPGKRVKTPTILQMEAAECGAAALTIVLGYYGLYLSLAEVRERCGVSRDGSKAINILKAARSYQLEANAYKVDTLEDLDELPVPSILFWGFNHFVVYEGRKGEHFFINDPAVGRRKLTRVEIGQELTGVVLTFKRTDQFQQGGIPFSFVESLKRRAQDCADSILYLVLISLTLLVPGILIPGFSKIFIDDILVNQNRQWLLPLMVGLAITALARAAFTWLQTSQMYRLQTKLLATSEMRLLWHLIKLPLSFFSQRFLGDITERITANQRITQSLSAGLNNTLINLSSLLFFLIVMFVINWILALFASLSLLIIGTLLYHLMKKTADLSYRFLQERGRLSGLQLNALQYIETIKACGSETIFFQRLAAFHAEMVNTQQVIAWYGLISHVLPQFIFASTQVLFIGIGGYLVMEGSLTLGTIVAMQSLLVSLQNPVQSLLDLSSELPKIRGDFARIDDVMEHPEDKRYENSLINEDNEARLSGELLIQSIEFGHSHSEPPILNDFSFSIAPGERVSIVGATGSGKSTVAKLIAGLYQPWSGTILFDNKTMEQIPCELFTNSLALVDQDSKLFSGTIQDNICLWNKDISEQALLSAIDDACLGDVIEKRGGLSAKVAESGTNFSGGECQRIELARALVLNPSILILDEATSALDPELEANVFERILRRNCSIINIAHRLSTVYDSKTIVVLDKGTIVQKGNHQQLISVSGYYQNLYKAEKIAGKHDE